MAYTPNNTYIYLAAFTGAMSGMGGFTRGPTSGNPGDYADIVRIATLFAKEVDTIFRASSDSLNIPLIQSLAAGLYAGRYQNGISQGDYEAQAGVLAAMVVAAEIGCATEIGPIPPYPPSSGSSATAVVQRVRGISNWYLRDLSNFLVVDVDGENNDGITYQQGDVVMLISQDAADSGRGWQNGPYVVGPVQGSYAPLSRPTWWQNNMVMTTGSVLLALGSEGRVYGNTLWRAMGPQTGGHVTSPANSFTVGNDDPGLYPDQVNSVFQMSSGQMMFYMPILSSNSHVNVTETSGTGHAGTVEYSSSIQPGSLGQDAYALVRALKADGTLNDADSGYVFFSCSNKGWWDIRND